LVGDTDNAGVFRITLAPSGSILGTAATFVLTDGSGGVFSGPNVVASAGPIYTLTIPQGQNYSNFRYTPATAGAKTITATPGGAASGFAAPTRNLTVTNKIIILDGDSRTDSRGGNDANAIYFRNPFRWPFHLQRRLQASAAVYNFAASGQQVSDQQADIATEIVPKIQSAIAAGGSVMFVNWSAGNSVSGISNANQSLTPAQVGQQIAGQIQTLCQAARNAGAKVMVFTDARRKNNMSIPYGFATWRGVRDEANFNLAVDEVNALIRTNWKVYADSIFDWGSDERNLNPQYESGIFDDGTHLWVGDVNTPSHPQAFGSSDVAEGVFALWKLYDLGGLTGASGIGTRTSASGT
jgi:hypothetical protein